MPSLTQGPVLVLAPHTDDAEFGCGGTIAKLVQQDCDVRVAIFSSCSNLDTEQNPYSKELISEMRLALDTLSVPEKHTYLFDYPVRNFDRHRQSILDQMILLRQLIDPALVFLPSTHDTHQDHQVICQEGFRSFKMSSLLGYELTWNNLEFSPGLFVELNEYHVSQRIKALNLYKSQASRYYSDPEAQRSMLRFRGVQINSTYAEAFEVVRILDRL